MYKWQTQEKITLEKGHIENADPHSTMLTGTGYIEHPWFNDVVNNLEDDGRSVKVNFVIYRGGIADWCIYHSLDANLERGRCLGGFSHLARSYEDVMRHGAKPHREEIIRAIINCTDEVYGLYRH